VAGEPPVGRELDCRRAREARLARLAAHGREVPPKALGAWPRSALETFLRNHASQVWSCDFFTVVTVHFQTFYAFVVVSLERRGIVHVGVTAHPTDAWVAQRMIEAVGDAPPRYLLHDRDSIYDGRFRGRLRGLGVRCLLSPPRAPLANAICERLVGTLRRDCLDHVLVLSERHAERIPARVRPLLPRPPASQPAQPAARRRALARSGTSSHIP
jgi:transposase InsO family protein